jgi:3',5'-cyclic AMP phosphodiesterase CpdA
MDMEKPSIARRRFLHRSLQGAAGLATWGFLNTVECAVGAGPADEGFPEERFHFAWISDTHLYPHGINDRFLERAARALRDIGAMRPAPDFLVFGGDLAHLGGAAELQLGAELLRQAGIPILCVPGEHDWYLDMGAAWNRLFGAAPWSIDHKGVRIVGLDTVSHAEDYWSPRGLDARQRMARMAVLDEAATGAWAALGPEQLLWLDRRLGDWPRHQPVMLFSHNPLYDGHAPWNFRVRDWRELHEILRPFARVTNIHGHCHQDLEHRTGTLLSIGMPATAWAWPRVGDREGVAAATGWCEVTHGGSGVACRRTST